MAAVPGDPLVRRRAGQLRLMSYTPYGVGTATYSPDMLYRFRLSRVWDNTLPRCVFLMLNPSTATEEFLDPTVTRCMKAAQRWGFGACEVVNLFAYRATDPTQLRTVEDPVGLGNDGAIRSAAVSADLFVVAWGVHGAFRARETAVVQQLMKDGVELFSLGVTKSGAPRHPLYLPSTVTPHPWTPDGNS